MLKLARRARGHFVKLIEIRAHLIRVKPGHISLVLLLKLKERKTKQNKTKQNKTSELFYLES